MLNWRLSVGRIPEPIDFESILVSGARFQFASAILLLICGAAPAVRAATDVAELQAQYCTLSQEFAAANPEWRPKAPATGSLLFIAPDEYSPESKAADAVSEARTKYAAALFDLAKQAADAGQLSLAFQWATETLRENPDHAEARRVLGYERRDGQWLTPYGVKMREAGKVWNAKLGWNAAGGAKPPFDKLRAQGQAADDKADAARHADIKNGWQVRTDHFLVTTNHSLAAGAELAARLERLYQVWRQLFAGFFYTEKEVRGLFAGDRNARTQLRPFRVFYYRDRDEYVEALRRRQPRIGETLGIYFDTTREAHFFAEAVAADHPAGGARSPAAAATAEPAVATLYHEAVHQLFQESKPTAKQVGALANFWVIEGVATYFETLTEHDGGPAGLYFTIGEATAGRLPAARQKLRDGFYVPLAELTKLNKVEVQRHPEIAKLYSQSSGVAAFLIDAEQGRYREPLVSYLQAIYAGRDNKESLSTTAGASFSELDAAYRRYLESLP
jgi:hypothetical protein